MSADWWTAALIVAGGVLAIWHARLERRRAMERVEAAMRGERKMHMEMERNLLKLRNDALADLRAAIFQHTIDIGEYQRENADLRRRLARPKGRARLATIQGEARHDAG